MFYILRVPPIFWTDHYDRCEDHPGERVVLARNDRFIRIKLDDEALDNLRSDAAYYSDGVDLCDRSLIRSARATLLAIARQLPDLPQI